MLVDFHSHTTESDGTLEPAALAAMMRERGVTVYSISDHDALGAYERHDLSGGPEKFVVGIEINSTYKDNEVHVLGYGFPLGSSELRETIEENRRSREDRAATMVRQLCEAGHVLTLDQVRAEAADDPALGRPHVAKALVRAGLAPSVDAAFRELLVPGKPGYVPQHYITPQRAVDVIKRAGGVPVLAHPCRLSDESLIDELAAGGIVGLEVFYPKHDAAQVAHYRALAERYGLVMTAGSDFHDPRWNPRGVGMEVEPADIQPFLDLVL